MKNQLAWPHTPRDYEWRGTIRETKLTTKFLAYCVPRAEKVIVEIKNIEMMWDMNEIDKYFGKIHEIMSIRHDNVLSPCHTFEHKSEIWIIYPLLSGGSLSELFKNDYLKGFPDEDVVGTILYDVACGLNAIQNSSQLLHKNIRSSSIHMCKLTGKALLKNFNSIISINKQYEKNANINVANQFENDIYSFGMLAMELCFGYLPIANKHILDTHNNNDNNTNISFDDYETKCTFDDYQIFHDLVDKCLTNTNITNNRISLKQILAHKFFTHRKCLYDKVIQCIEPLKSTESKLSQTLNLRKESIFAPKLKAKNGKNSVEFLFANIKCSNGRSLDPDVNDVDVSWDFDLDIGDTQQPLILDQVEYDDHGIGIDMAVVCNTPMHAHNYSNTMQSTISHLSPFVSSSPLCPLNALKNSGRDHDLPNIIKLNVGGIRIFSTTLTTLRKYDTMLSKKFSGVYDAEYDETTDSYFIDRDGSHFSYILNYLRSGKLIIPTPTGKNKYDPLFYEELYEEVCYYQIHPLIKILNRENIYFYSTILGNEDCVSILKEWIANPTVASVPTVAAKPKRIENKESEMEKIKNQKWKLIYRASEDGYESYEFHRHCDLQGATITLIHSNNRIFGGFTNISWKSDSRDKYTATKDECANTFIFVMNITNDVNNLKAFKWNFIDKYYSSYGSNLPVVHEKNIGPAFGWYHVLKKRGNDINNISNELNQPSQTTTISQDGIIIGDKCNIQNNSCWTYCAYFNTPKNSAHLAGSKYFFVKDIEVYQISFT